MAPDTAAVAAFLAERQAASDRRLTTDQQAIWKVAAREGWSYSTIASAFVQVRAWHDRAEASVGAGGGPLEEAAPGGGAGVVVRGDHLPAVAAEGAGRLAEVGQGHRFLPVLPIAALDAVRPAQPADGAGGVVHRGPVYRTQKGSRD